MTAHNYYTIYETTNLINGKKYRGKHSSRNPNDQYLGTGTAIKRAIKYYGKENFKKEVIFMAFDPLSLDWAETILVDEEWVNRDDTYNLVLGGYGGHKGIVRSQENRRKISNGLKGYTCSVERREKIRLSLLGNTPWNKGVPATEERKKKQRESMIRHPSLMGDSNPAKRHEVRVKLAKPKSNLARMAMIESAKLRPKCSCLLCHKEISSYQISNHFKASHSETLVH